jgi:fatty-acyl-CoA synthase
MGEDDVITGTLPLFHAAGIIFAGLCIFMAGGHILIMSPGGLRNPAMVEGFWRLVEQYKVTRVGGVPTGIGAISQVAVGDHDISSVRSGGTGASLLPPAVGERFKAVTGCPLFEIYGMTESSGLISIDPMAGPGCAGSVGWPLPYTKVEILRLNADGGLGDPCDVGEIGEIVTQGPHIPPGYKDPAQNAGVYDGDRLNTGDLGYKDAEGRIFVAGRTKDIIIRSGHNLDPAMIENAMAKHPAVALAAAVGMPDAYAGELPVCFIQLHPDSDVTEAELRAHAEKHIDERPAWPKQIHVIEAIPLTAVGKIFKPTLRCQAARQMVSDLLADGHGLAGAEVTVETGGSRGLRVTVTLPGDRRDAQGDLEAALGAFQFEALVRVA